MVKKASLILFLILNLVLTSTAFAQSTSEIEQICAKDGYELINRIGNPFSSNVHYSKKLAGCFARAAFYEHQNDGKVHATIYLYSVSDSKIIGFVSYIDSQSSDCWVGKTKCKSADEFDDLISPYIDR